jgi:two-component system phosphate regulon sensor histidine kinase PhoR
MRLRWRLPLAFVLSTALLAGIVALVSALILRPLFLDRLEDDMARQAQQYAAVLTFAEDQATSGDSLQSLTQSAGSAGETRLTVIAHDGKVLADSEADPTTLQNHSTRPEVAQALAGHEGRARRESATFHEQMVYVAIPLPAGDRPWSGGALRTALSATRVDAMVSASWRIPLIVWAILLLPTLVVAYLLSRSLTRPISRLVDVTGRVAGGDLSARNAESRRDELGQLARALNGMTEQLERRGMELAHELERSRGVLSAMSEGVLLADADGRLLRSNPAAAVILGTPLEGREGTPLVHLARVFPAQRLAQAAGEAGRPLTEVLDLPDGRSLTVETVPLRSTGKENGQTLFVMRDETERRKTEAVRRDFVANASHELKTPLTGLSLLTDTLRVALRDDPDKAAQCVDQLRSETQRLANLTNDLLTLSRLEERQASAAAARDTVDLAELARETAAAIRPRATAKQQDLKVEAPDKLMLTGDAAALSTLIHNLLDNAVRYTDDSGRITLQAQTAEDPQGRDFAMLSVTDDGMGIPSADQTRIFERFYRVDKARSRDTGGTGLGLSIVRHVAESHGGSVEVQSTLGVGSTFTVRLPLTQTANPEDGD